MTDADFLRAILADPEDDGPRLAYADWLEERGRCAEAESLRSTYPKYAIAGLMDAASPERIRSPDWLEVFAFAGAEGGCNSGKPERALPNDADTSIEPFSRLDVKRVIASAEGENDGPNWLVVGELHDGRFFAISAGCDYTGWD